MNKMRVGRCLCIAGFVAALGVAAQPVEAVCDSGISADAQATDNTPTGKPENSPADLGVVTVHSTAPTGLASIAQELQFSHAVFALVQSQNSLIDRFTSAPDLIRQLRFDEYIMQKAIGSFTLKSYHTADPDAFAPIVTSSSTRTGTTGGSGPTTKNPVDISSGNKLEEQLDFTSSGESPLELIRTYNQAAGKGIFGPSWISSFDYTLSFGTVNPLTVCDAAPGAPCSPPAIPDSISTNRPDGSQVVFDYNATLGYWVPHYGDSTQIVKKSANGWTLSSSDDIVENYNASGFITSLTDATGLSWIFTYDANNYLQQVSHTSGRTVRFSWAGNRLTSVIDPAGSTYLYGYNSSGMLSSVSYPGTPTNIYSYAYENASYPSALTGIYVDGVRYGTFSYDAIGRVVGDGLGSGAIERLTFDYDTNGIQTRVINAAGVWKIYTYQRFNSQLLLQSITQSAVTGTTFPRAATFTYDSTGQPATKVDFNGNETDTHYDSLHRLTSVTTGINPSFPGAARSKTTVWDGSRMRPTSIVVSSPNGNILQIDSTYYPTTDPARNRLSSVAVKNLSPNGISGQTRTVTFSYQFYPNGMLKQQTETKLLPGGGVTNTFTTFDGLGNLVLATDSLGHTLTQSNFTGLGLPQSIVDSNGFQTTFLYDARSRPIQKTRILGGVSKTIKNTYDGMGNVVSITFPEPGSIARTYDAAGRVTVESSQTFESDAADQWYKKYTYDNLSDVTNFSIVRMQQKTPICGDSFAANGGQQSLLGFLLPSSSSTTATTCYQVGDFQVTTLLSQSWTYDEIGRKTATLGTHGQNMRYSHDPNGNVLTTTDSLNRITTNTYNSHDELITRKDPFNTQPSRYSYDGSGHLVSVTDPRGLLTSYAFDGFADNVSISNPDIGQQQFSFDIGGRLQSARQNDGTLTNYYYDALSRISSIQAPGASQAYTYDTCTNGVGRLCGISDGATSIAYSFDAAGRMVGQTDTVAGTAYPFIFGYDGEDRIVSITHPDNVKALYSYDALQQLSGVQVVIGGVTKTLATLSYQRLGPMTSIAFGNGVTQSFTYDSDRRMSFLSVPSVQSHGIGYDVNDNLTGISDSLNTARSETVAYDTLLRINSVTTGTGTPQSYALDGNGNRSSLGGPVVETYQVATTSNRLNSITGTRARSYSYDGRGNEHTETGWRGNYTFNYDSWNRLTSVSGSTATTYTYDALGRRVRKSGVGTAVTYAYGPTNEPLSETLNGSTTIGTDYIWLGNRVIGLVRSGQLYYVHDDHLGRPETITNSTKSIVWQAINQPFDRMVASNLIGGFNLGFPGQYFDSETGLYYNINRTYDPTTGRFIQADPLGLGGGINPYIYALATPTSVTDPTGLTVAFISLTGRAVAGGGGSSQGGIFLAGGGEKHALDVGLFGRGGVSLGDEGGGDAAFGMLFHGGAEGFSEKGKDLHASGLVLGGALLYDMEDHWVGFEIGPSAEVGASASITQGTYWSVMDAVDHVIDNFTALGKTIQQWCQ